MSATLALNKKVRHNYNILDNYQAGIVLSGPEVKSAKAGRTDISAGYVVLDNKGQASLINARIASYPPAAGVQTDYLPTRSRRLLLTGKELVSLAGKLHTKGLTALPIRVYTKNTLIKIEIGVCRGKKLFDKRETLKRRDIDRKVKRQVRGKI